MDKMFKQLTHELKALAHPEKALINQRFFKTSVGSYSENAQFLGITVPQLRQLAKAYQTLEFAHLKILLTSAFNEERVLALLILIEQFNNKKNLSQQKLIYEFVIENIEYVNNWNLVDGIAPQVIGAYLFDKNKIILKEWARDKNLWKRRLAIIATYYFIKQNSLEDTLFIAELLINDKHDLIHKAVGWMLREAAKRNSELIEEFLDKHHQKMPRTMLRYAIERFPETKRKKYIYTK